MSRPLPRPEVEPEWMATWRRLARRAAGLIPLVGPHRPAAPTSIESAAGYGASTALSICGLALLPCAVVGIVDGGRVALTLAVCAVVTSAIGIVGRRRLCFPDRIRSGMLLSSVLVTWLAMIVVSSIVYVAAGTASVGDALFESVSGFTTTALTMLDPDDIDRSIVLWRAGTQWIGGFAALMTVLVVLPFLGVGSAAGDDLVKSTRSSQLVTARVRRQIRRFLYVYLALTTVGIVLFLIGGMVLLDAVSYALTTVSTGGFASHAGSFAHFDSALLEWFALGGMLLAGANFALLWSTAVGRASTLWHSFELRAYLSLFVVASAWLVVDSLGGGISHESVRRSMFAVASVLSTTGHTVEGWGSWGPRGQIMLLVAMGIGAMSGSTGGGFRVIRVVVLFDLMRRELIRQIRPHEVVALRTGTGTVDERVAGRMISHQVLWIGTGLLGAVAIAATGIDPLTAIVRSISVLATNGVGILDPSTSAAGFAGGAQVALMFMMLCGRLAFYPIVAGLVAIAQWLRWVPAEFVLSRTRT